MSNNNEREQEIINSEITNNSNNNNNNNNNNSRNDNTSLQSIQAKSRCSHNQNTSSALITFSGDLICPKCGQVIQGNSQLTSDSPIFIERVSNHSGYSQIPVNLHKFTHQERSEAALRQLLCKLIDSFALKPSYESEAFELMHRYWLRRECKQRYGMVGNRLLVAVLFLLARRDGLAVNLNLLTRSIDAVPQDCGEFLDQLVKMEPSLRSLAKVDDFIERAIDQLSSKIKVTASAEDSQKLLKRTERIAKLLNETESGSSRSAECVALAAAWISFAALFPPDTPLKLFHDPISEICESSALSFKSVKAKYNALIDKLLERAEVLLPATFANKLTRPRKIALLFDCLDHVV